MQEQNFQELSDVELEQVVGGAKGKVKKIKVKKKKESWNSYEVKLKGGSKESCEVEFESTEFCFDEPV